MNLDIYYGCINECTYAGMAGNMFGVPHYKVIEEGVYFIKVGEGEYVRLDDIVSGVKKPKVYRKYATKRGEHYIGSISSVRNIILKFKKMSQYIDRLIELDNINKIILDENKIILDENTEIRKK